MPIYEDDTDDDVALLESLAAPPAERVTESHGHVYTDTELAELYPRCACATSTRGRTPSHATPGPSVDYLDPFPFTRAGEAGRTGRAFVAG